MAILNYRVIKNAAVSFMALLLLGGCHKQWLVTTSNIAAPPSFTPWSISNSVLGGRLTISSSARFAGAISSLNWNGKEFLNSSDHGRELQSAATFDGLGECFNPTEAGSSIDGAGDSSTSKLISFNTSINQIQSSTQMAFWTGPGAPYPAGCGMDTSIKVAQNTAALSNHILTKKVTVGFSGISNVIEFLVTFHVAEHHTSAIFESLTGYLTQDFTSFWTFDPATRSLNSLSYGPGEQSKPIIFSTNDKNYAMGIYSPDLPQQAFPGEGYGRYSYLPEYTVKWSAFFRTGDTPVGDYNFRLYVVIGTLSDVTTGMASVYKVFYP